MYPNCAGFQYTFGCTAVTSCGPREINKMVELVSLKGESLETTMDARCIGFFIKSIILELVLSIFIDHAGTEKKQNKNC